MKKETLVLGLIGMFTGLVFSKMLIYFLRANGIKAAWMMHHHVLINLTVSLLFGTLVVLCTVLRKNK